MEPRSSYAPQTWLPYNGSDADNTDTVQARVDAGADVNIRFCHVISHPMLADSIRFHTTPLVAAGGHAILFLARNAWQAPQLIQMLKLAGAKDEGDHR